MILVYAAFALTLYVVPPAGQVVGASEHKGHQLIADDSGAEAASPGIHPAKNLVSPPEDEAAFQDNRQGNARPPGGRPDPEQGAGDDDDPEEKIRPLRDSDGPCFAAPEEPLEEPPHHRRADQIVTSPSSRPFQ